MKKYLLTLFILFSSVIYSQDSSLNVEKDELVLEVNGMVCGMCAFGIQEGLSELSFLNNKKFEEDGIEVQAAPKEEIKQPHLDNSVVKDTEWTDLY